MIKVLLAGETWISESTHHKGFDSFTSVTFHSGADAYIKALASQGISVQHMAAHDIPQQFPRTAMELSEFDVIVLSDIGANSFQLPPETWLEGKSSPDRLAVLAQWVHDGGALMMAGGYLSFQGFQARANFARSAIAPALPVEMVDYDDRVETSAGAVVHPVGDGMLASFITSDAPVLLGYNRVTARMGATVHATVGEDVLIATSDYGKGRTLVWTSDIGPHWCPNEFVDWPGYGPLMSGMIQWLAGTKVAN
jgi:uncharacterized membrane protein